jgi:hypothetical protein
MPAHCPLSGAEICLHTVRCLEQRHARTLSVVWSRDMPAHCPLSGVDTCLHTVRCLEQRHAYNCRSSGTKQEGRVNTYSVGPLNKANSPCYAIQKKVATIHNVGKDIL